MDLIRELGVLAFASRLRRISEKLSKDVSKFYKAQNIDFEARWFPVFYLLKDGRSMAVTEIASALGMTHPSVNQIAKSMANRGILTSSRDNNDERRRLLRLTKKGKLLIPKLEPIWDEVKVVAQDLIDSTGVDFLQSLSILEQSVDDESVLHRMTNRLRKRQYNSIEILDYKPQYRKYFESLNREWLEQYFEIEPSDRAILRDPNGSVIRKGGFVLFAKLDGEIVGTCAMIPVDSGSMKLTKMAVTEAAQGRQVGRRLADEAIKRARSTGAESILLETSTKLIAATALYRKLGFVEYGKSGSGDSEHARTSFSMKLNLDKYSEEQ
jgi:DNA-binding MarR family transcriptional regulator/predicted GNAT family N-acyltransferase